MKKAICIILAMMMAIMVASAVAETCDGIAYGISFYDAEKIAEEYGESKGLDDWMIRNDVNGVLYGLGGVCLEDFEHDSGMEGWSINNFDAASIAMWDICEIHTIEVETVNGITFYHTQAQSETTPLGWKDGKSYYCADVVFFVFSQNEKEI